MTDLPKLANGLIRFADVRAAGADAELKAALASGAVERVRRGVYAPTASDDRVGAAESYRTVVLAAAETLLRPVFTSFSSLALRGLPIYGAWPSDVYCMSRDSHGRKRHGLISVAGSYSPAVDIIDGVACTSIEFTLIQICRHATLAAALCAVDAAMRTPRFGATLPLVTIEALRAEHQRLLPYPGSRRTEAVLERATTLADSPLETVSRLVIEELGFEAPELQYELWLPELGARAFLDFRWHSVDACAEADGRGKYQGGVATGSGDAAARAAAGAVIREKDRENAIRRHVRAFDRWDWSDMVAKHPVERRLITMGVPRPRRARRLVGKATEPAALPPRRGRTLARGSNASSLEQDS